MEWRGWIAGSWVDLGDESGVDWKAVKAWFQWKGRGGRGLNFAKAEEENWRWLSLSGRSLSQGDKRWWKEEQSAGFIGGTKLLGALRI